MGDRELIDALIRGESGAPEEFLRRFGRLIYYIARAKFHFSPEDADDLMQKVCMALLEDGYRRLRAWRGRGDFAPYLTPIVHHMALNVLQAQKNQPVQMPDSEDEMPIADPDPAPDDHAQLAEIRRFLQECYERLAERARELIRLRHWEGFTQAQTAQALGITSTNAGVALLRAERQLRECLSNKMGDRPWVLA